MWKNGKKDKQQEHCIANRNGDCNTHFRKPDWQDVLKIEKNFVPAQQHIPVHWWTHRWPHATLCNTQKCRECMDKQVCGKCIKWNENEQIRVTCNKRMYLTKLTGLTKYLQHTGTPRESPGCSTWPAWGISLMNASSKTKKTQGRCHPHQVQKQAKLGHTLKAVCKMVKL